MTSKDLQRLYRSAAPMKSQSIESPDKSQSLRLDKDFITKEPLRESVKVRERQKYGKKRPGIARTFIKIISIITYQRLDKFATP